VFIDNEIYKELLYNGNIMYMPIIAQSISFSFNGLNKNDLSFTNKNVDYLPCAVLFFYKENNRIYIGYIVKIRESEKRIVDILNI
jgi:hypothetical protein